jgi:hypothetical protein
MKPWLIAGKVLHIHNKIYVVWLEKRAESRRSWPLFTVHKKENYSRVCNTELATERVDGFSTVAGITKRGCLDSGLSVIVSSNSDT